MPGLRNVSGGQWVNHARTRPKFSPFRCPVCGFWLHEYLIRDGEHVHLTCADDPAYLNRLQVERRLAVVR